MGLLGGELDYDYPTVEQPRGNSHIRHSRARVLGGCSSHNTLISFKPLPSDWDEWEAAGAKGWGAVPHGGLLRPPEEQHRLRRREGPERHRPRLRRRRPVGARSTPGRGLQPQAVRRGRRLLRPRLPPRDQQAVLRVGGVPAPGDGRAAQPDDPAGDLGVPAGAGRHPRRGRARAHQGRRGTADPRAERGRPVRRRRRLPAPAAPLGHRPAGGPGGARHPRRARPARRRREPARPPRVGHRLGRPTAPSRRTPRWTPTPACSSAATPRTPART